MASLPGMVAAWVAASANGTPTDLLRLCSAAAGILSLIGAIALAIAKPKISLADPASARRALRLRALSALLLSLASLSLFASLSATGPLASFAASAFWVLGVLSVVVSLVAGRWWRRTIRKP
jgi:hypothetical protein